MTARRLVFGCMTGTSIDALDAAAVEILGVGTSITARVAATTTLPLGDLAEPARRLASGAPMPAGDVARLALALGALHADAALDLSARVGPPDFTAMHGQTVFHAPPASWQLANPWPVVRATGRPVLHDLRGADLAAGGQGAPITPLADWTLFRDPSASRAVVNLGGFCNITVLPAGAGPDDVSGRDVCACNQVLDAVARRALRAPYDAGGTAALRGRVLPGAAVDLAQLLAAQARAGRSLGTGDEAAGWLERWGLELAPDDLAASAARAVGEVIGAALADAGVDEAVCAGGGAWNRALLMGIREAAGVGVRASDELGFPIAHREAAAMATLAALCADGVPITLPRVTGVPAPAPLAGSWAGGLPARA